MFGTTCWTVDDTLEKNEVKMNNRLQCSCFSSLLDQVGGPGCVKAVRNSPSGTLTVLKLPVV